MTEGGPSLLLCALKNSAGFLLGFSFPSYSTLLTLQIRNVPSIGFEQKLRKRRNKNSFLLGFELKSPGWEPTVTTRRLHSGITVLLQFIYPFTKFWKNLGDI